MKNLNNLLQQAFAAGLPKSEEELVDYVTDLIVDHYKNKFFDSALISVSFNSSCGRIDTYEEGTNLRIRIPLANIWDYSKVKKMMKENGFKFELDIIEDRDRFSGKRIRRPSNRAFYFTIEVSNKSFSPSFTYNEATQEIIPTIR